MSNVLRVYCKRHSDHPCFYLSDADKHLDSIYIDAACVFAGWVNKFNFSRNIFLLLYS